MKNHPSQGQPTPGEPDSPISNQNFSIPRQQDLAFEQGNEESINDDILVRSTITASIRACPLSREQIADAMTAMLGIPVTAKMLNNYSSEAMRPNRFPAAWDRAFCRATGDNSLLVCRVLKAGFFVINAEEHDLMELGRQYLIRKRADEQAQLLEKRLGGLDL